ncbi:hypothetical protein [Coxiella-like endosymbiont of Rhipicephalus sanguineus]|nr:hypothetical protein [Coxiella-like endosymbiont of Rhipicephalus sanguineus]
MTSKGNHARVWFGESSEVDQEISQRFSADLDLTQAIKGQYVE